MNLVDFHVTEIIDEEYNKIYKLYNMTEDEAMKEEDVSWRKFLLQDGVKQTYKYWDDGGEFINSQVFRLGHQYKVGYVGQH